MELPMPSRLPSGRISVRPLLSSSRGRASLHLAWVVVSAVVMVMGLTAGSTRLQNKLALLFVLEARVMDVAVFDDKPFGCRTGWLMELPEAILPWRAGVLVCAPPPP
eukprot:CAMPEP_0198687678 /NCGR_PEP_ID=MMETSP1468-20131203/71603_1 /TAXON_ID=1461545 /ORGANISM="Mantoniella sp, Strain CCMP1436" /LENGTH=106 /DNA_ID=CAMNT_0044435997 /DNA_START=931 /DNA_END=1248 /DNA_ORIENTATION=-